MTVKGDRAPKMDYRASIPARHDQDIFLRHGCSPTLEPTTDTNFAGRLLCLPYRYSRQSSQMWSSTFDTTDPVIGDPDSVLRGRYRLPPSQALLDRTCRTHRTGTSRRHPCSPLPPSGEVFIVVLILLFEYPRSNVRLRSPQGTLLPLRHAQLGLFSTMTPQISCRCCGYPVSNLN